MAVLDILKFPDPRLRRKCAPVQAITPELIKLADDMLETMSFRHGLGLSAIQVNHFTCLLTADTRALYNNDEPSHNQNGNKRYESPLVAGPYEQQVSQPLVLFNPEIIKSSGKIVFKEGCLSFPSYYAEVTRSAFVEVRGWNKEEKNITVKADGVLAICLQHEIDHLNGRLFIDHLSPLKAEKLRAQIKKHGYPPLNKVSAESPVTS